MVGCSKSKMNGRWKGKGAVYLAGSKNSYIKINDGTILNPDEDDYTVYVWFKPTTKNTRFILSKGNGRYRESGWSFYQNRNLFIRTRATSKKTYRGKNKILN